MSIKEYAEREGISYAAAKMRLHRQKGNGNIGNGNKVTTNPVTKSNGNAVTELRAEVAELRAQVAKLEFLVLRQSQPVEFTTKTYGETVIVPIEDI